MTKQFAQIYNLIVTISSSTKMTKTTKLLNINENQNNNRKS